MKRKLSNRERILILILGMIVLITTAFYGLNEFPLLKKAALSLPVGVGSLIEDGGGLVHYINNKAYCVLLSLMVSFAIIFQVKNRKYKDFISESNQNLMCIIVAFMLITCAYYFNFHLQLQYLG